MEPVFAPGEAKRYLERCAAIRVKSEASGGLTLIPQIFAKYDLAALESLGPETRRTIPANSSAKGFWEAFDEVLAAASEQ